MDVKVDANQCVLIIVMETVHLLAQMIVLLHVQVLVLEDVVLFVQ